MAGPSAHGRPAGGRKPARPVPEGAGVCAQLGIDHRAAGVLLHLRDGERDVTGRGVANARGYGFIHPAFSLHSVCFFPPVPRTPASG